MKTVFQMLVVFVVGPAVAIALFYLVCAFVAWDWWWAWTADAGARGFFVVFSVFPAALGCVGAASVVSEFE